MMDEKRDEINFQILLFLIFLELVNSALRQEEKLVEIVEVLNEEMLPQLFQQNEVKQFHVENIVGLKLLEKQPHEQVEILEMPMKSSYQLVHDENVVMLHSFSQGKE
eukprot:TRINITY_DN2400_c0_g1_i4.p2 TRINITY_DN2400_c0_g1~~TRINITY_DN2400_c0_g1_i4.p2  ORF type:complete len:107 (-),score=12.22 TRINITY_DN2400_c0_g1_i4:536-856(-)